jgi:hypothetical protein
MGDVLEHLSIEDSQKILNKIVENKQECLIAVPYLCEQGTMEENEYETHLQPELTPELVIRRYPQLDLLVKNEYYGYYINRRGEGNIYWDLDVQKFVEVEKQKILLDSISEDQVYLINVSDKTIYVNAQVSSDLGSHYETNMKLVPNVGYFVSVNGNFPNKKISLISEGINKYYWMN